MEIWRVGWVICETRMTTQWQYMKESQFPLYFCNLCATHRHTEATISKCCLISSPLPSPAVTDVRFLPEELTVIQLVASFPIIYRTVCFINDFTGLKRAVPYSVTNESTQSPVFIRFNLWLPVPLNSSPNASYPLAHKVPIWIMPGP